MSNAPAATETDRYGFPIKTCSRCGGTGRHSFNLIDGDRCYGCGGTGKVYANAKVKAARAALSEAIRTARECVSDALVAGDEILDKRPEARLPNGNYPWVRIAAIERTDRACRWDTTGGRHTPNAWFLRVTLADGRVLEDFHGAMIVRRRQQQDIDVRPFLAMAGVKA